MTTMRAKMRVADVVATVDVGANVQQERLKFTAVAAKAYPADGSDENNSFAKWTPQAEVTMTVNNPALFGKFAIGDEFYVDFTKAD